MRELEILADKAALTNRAAHIFLQIAYTSNDRFSVALAGGSTPRDLYTWLSEAMLPTPLFSNMGILPGNIPSAFSNGPLWAQTDFFWGDERPVPPDHPDSNYRMSNEALLSKIAVPPQNVHRIQAERQDAAELYEAELRHHFGSEPSFDLVLLGMGVEGHTASLFPDSEALKETQRWVVPNWVEKLNSRRITLTLPALNAAKNVIFLVSGADKAQAVRQIIKEQMPLPAALVQPKAGRLVWLLDRAAASQL